MKLNQIWFENSVVTGGSPSNKMIASAGFNHHVVINVDSNYSSDEHDLCEARGIVYHWFPMNECSSDMGVNSIYAAMQILYLAEKSESFVYLHCAVGANRSPTVKECYHFMRTGKYTEDKVVKCDPDIQKMFIGHENETHYISKNKLLQNIDDGFLPEKHKIELFLRLMNHQLNENKIDLEALKNKSGIS